MNPITVHYLNVVLGASAIILQVLFLLVFFLLFFRSKKGVLLDFIEKHFLVIGFLVSLAASLFSLVYSEVINFIPCQLCWFQRIFLFPQVFLFGIALWNRDRSIVKYSTPLLCVGFVISVYQNFIYYFGNSSGVPCDTSGISCYQHLINEYNGYISIPMLALTSFFVLLVTNLVVHFYKKND
jgi:disulfide bond formation protein DsbB